MNETLRTLVTRRSVRSYLPEQVKEEQLKEILEASTYAASGMGMQSPIMIVVQDPETIKYLSGLNAEVMGTSSDPFYGAPTVVVVLADKNKGTCVEDGSLVMGNLMNAASSLGVASCWIHRAREVFESEEGKALLKKWGIEGEYIGVGHCLLGYADGEEPKAKPRKENYIYYVR
jgi:nitroreductase